VRKYIRKLYLVQSSGAATFYPGLNAAKGILILLVIFTHCLPPGMILYFNYLFHMPVFMAISGFLLKRSVFNKGLINYLKSMAKRLIIPWVIACVIYLPLHLGWQHIGKYSFINFLYPYFHLWYIPAFLLAGIISYCVIRFKLSAWLVLLITGFVTVVWYLVYRDNSAPVDRQPLYYFGEKRFYAYAYFFILGFSLRNNLIKLHLRPLYLLTTLLMAFAGIVWSVYANQFLYITVVLFMIFNTSLVLYLVIYIAPRNWMQHKFLLFINKQSLGIYLYHPLLMFVIYRFIGHADRHNVSNAVGLAVGVAVVVVVLGIIWLLKQWAVINRLLLGNYKKNEPAQKISPAMVKQNNYIGFTL